MLLHNSLTAVAGLRVGHATDLDAATGCTVILCPEGTVGAVDVRGGSPGTRETDLLGLARHVQTVNAILLTGGSAFGLDAATGVVRYLAERNVGYDARGIRIPIVPAAVIFDLAIGRSQVRPDAEFGYRAAADATEAPVVEGSVGAGTGATVGKILGMTRATKSGVGSSAIQLGSGAIVAALIVVNALGDVVHPQTGRIIAGPRDPVTNSPISSVAQILRRDAPVTDGEGSNTVIGVVATDAALTRDQLHRVAQMAHDGLARTIRPSHTPYDGDTIFALATGTRSLPVDVLAVGVAAAEVVATAIVRAVTRTGTSTEY